MVILLRIYDGQLWWAECTATKRITTRKADLEKAIQEVWDGLEKNIIRKLANSISKRLTEVVAAKGYW